MVGTEDLTLQAGRFLFEHGYYVQSVIFPAVPHGSGVLRMQVNANHASEQIDGLLVALAALKRALPLPGTESDSVIRFPENATARVPESISA